MSRRVSLWLTHRLESRLPLGWTPLKTRPTIVVADDFPAFLQKLVSLLDGKFHIVATAVCVQSALEAIRRCRPDLVLVDLNMPGLNGIEVTRESAKDPSGPRVVICSAESDPEVIQAAREAGAVACVTKSRLEADLIPALNSAVQ